MIKTIIAKPLTDKAFSPFGEIIARKGRADKIINQGNCARFHDLADLDFVGGRAGISIFQAKPYPLPLSLDMMERHPLGSQAFIPMYATKFLVIVAKDDCGSPADIQAFLCPEYQGIHYFRNIWHAVLTPLEGEGLFIVVDRIGEENNLEEYDFKTPVMVSLS